MCVCVCVRCVLPFSLQERGFDSFLRIGSLPRIARRVLPRSLHAADGSRDAAAQLKQMIACEEDPLEKRLLTYV